MVLICGKSTLMVRAAQMVFTCNRSSDATPAGSANWNCWAATGALAANDPTSAGVAVCAAPAGVGDALVGAGDDAAGLGARRGCSLAWA